MTWPAIITFVIVLSRELVKDVVDLEGDAEYGVATVPVMFGVRATVVLISTLALATVVISGAAAWVAGLGMGFLIVFAVLDGVLLWYVLRLWKHPTRGVFQEFRAVTGVMFLFGILAFFLGSL